MLYDSPAYKPEEKDPHPPSSVRKLDFWGGVIIEILGPASPVMCDQDLLKPRRSRRNTRMARVVEMGILVRGVSRMSEAAFEGGPQCEEKK